MTDRSYPSDEELRSAIASLEAGKELDPGFLAYLDQNEDCQKRMEQLANDPGFNETLRSALAEEQPTSARLIETINHLSSRKAALSGLPNPRYDDLEPWIDRSDSDGAEALDSYALIECIGRGGMGIVFKARDIQNNRLVALKTMLPELARDELSRDRFMREARAIAAVHHPNVVAMHDVSEVKGLPYLIMEHVDGISLEYRMRNDPKLNPDEIIRIAAAVADGLAACHERAVVHRDIKPSNVLIRKEDSAVKITDFGLAAIANTPTLTQNGYLSGTPDYVAPERLAIGAEADERSDLFSLGCLLYKMSTGEEPFGGESPLITLHRIATDDPPPVRTKNPAIPLHLEKAIASLMTKRPDDRPPSAKAARDMLLVAPPPREPHIHKYHWAASLLAVAAASALIIYVVARPETPPQREESTRAETKTTDEFTPGPAIAIAPELQPNTTGKIIVTTAAELESAVNIVPHGGRIELDTDETLLTQPLYIDGKTVTIAAAEGREPTIELKKSSDGPAPEYLLRLYHGSLSLKGVGLQDSWDAETHARRVGGEPAVAEQYSLVSMIDGDVNITGCRLMTGTVGACVKCDPGNAISIADSEVFAPEGTGIKWHAIDGDGLEINNCVVIGTVAVSTALEGNADIVLEESVILADQSVLELNPARGKLIVTVIDCTIHTQQALVEAWINPPSLSQFKQTVNWHGNRNRIVGKKVYLTENGYSPSWAQEVGGWASVDTESTYYEELFSFPYDEIISRLMNGQSAESMLLENPEID
ncbi:MAG: serine/threonine-protein kinase [Planctomycetota bacterium]